MTEEITFSQLMYLDNRLTIDDCVDLFGESIGMHLWEKKERIDNTLYFYNALDKNNKTTLYNWAKSK
jgi:hypothetical protein